MTNCIIFAFRLFYRRWRSAARRNVRFNGYIVIRFSRIRYGFIHLLYGELDDTTNTIRVISYKPIKPDKSGIEIIFNGRVTRGDK